MSAQTRHVAVLFIAATLAGVAAAQQDNPVYVDDSPRAWELFRQARDQAADNAGEAIRLYGELLDDYRLKLLPADVAAADHFTDVRARVLAELQAHDALLERFRLAETAEARRLLADGRLERLAATRSLTAPGLEALLRLGQHDLEAGHFRSALDRLEQAVGHPDLDPQRSAHLWYMIGVAAAYLDLPLLRVRALEELDRSEADAEGLAERLAGFADAPAPPFPEAVSTLDPGGTADLERLVSQPIWTVSLPATPLSRRLADPAGGGPIDRRQADQWRRSGEFLTAAPTVAGSRVYVNEGRAVHGVDRFTGRELWSPYQEPQALGSVDKSRRHIAGLNVVTVEAGTLVTLTGHAYADAARSERAVVCLDAETGRPRWSRRIETLSTSDEFEGLFPHGVPVIGEGMVYVLARKLSRQLLTSCYVVALHLADGSLAWARHVASSGGIRSRFARPFSTPLWHEGDLAVATSIGAVARLDATTGRILWLRRFNPPLSPYLADRQPWEVGGPVMTARGVVAIRPDHREVVLLDWATGELLESVPATARDSWNSPRYLLVGGGMIFGVGSEIRAFHAGALDRLHWTFPPPVRGPGSARPALEQAELLGRVQVVDNGLLVPTTEGLLLLDGETGEVRHRVELDVAGTPLAAGPQLLLAAADRLEAYMPLERAEAMLREQIAAAPREPAPALALMRLGARVGDLDLALDAAELAIDAIHRADAEKAAASRRELFDVLLELDRAQLAGTRPEGEALHAMIGLVAREPTQRVEHHLAYGRWLADHELGRAVEAYQTILSAPELAAAPRRHEDLVRPAGAWAAGRIASLIDRHGRGVYGAQADFARRRLEELRRGGVADPQGFVALAREFPFAEASLEAARTAAEMYAGRRQPRRAVEVLTGAYRLAPARTRAEALLGPAVTVAAEAGWSRLERDILSYVVDTYGQATLRAAVGRRDAADWLAQLRQEDGAFRLPRIGDIRGTAMPLRGAVVPRHPASPAPLPPDRVLLYDAPELALLSSGLESIWATVVAESGEPHVLRFDDEGLLLWIEHPDDPRALLLDAVDGSQRWSSPDLRDLVEDWAAGAAPQRQQRTRALPLVVDDLLVVVGPAGRVVAMQLPDAAARAGPAAGRGGRQRWTRAVPPPVHRVSLAAAHDLGVVLAGTRRTEAGEELPVLVVLDPLTGRTLHELRPGDGTAPTWLTVGPLGALLFGRDAGVTAADLLSGGIWWTNLAPELTRTERGWVVGASVLVDRATPPGGPVNPLRAVGVADGVATAPFDAPQHGDWDRDDLRGVVISDGRIFARYGQRIIRFDADGNVLGADVVSDQRDYRWLLPTQDRLLAVSHFETGAVAGPGGRHRRQHAYRIYAFSANCRLIGDGIELPSLEEPLEGAAVIDDWLLVSTASRTLAVSLPADRSEAPAGGQAP